MGDKKVIFLGKEYNISDQLPILVPILRCFDGYKEILLNKLLEQMNKNRYSDGTEEQFSYWSQPIRNIAKDIIKGAASVGVYDLTEYDVVENNPGYKKLQQVCTETMRQMLLSKTEAMLDYMKGYDDAYASAASNITGSGVGILTNSLSGALLYSAMEGSVLRKQAREADKQFNAALSSLKSRKDSKQRQDENRIKANVYYPGCKDSIELLVSYMLEIYLKKLNENNCINCAEISHYDIQASSQIMKNLDVIPQKAEVLGKAFEKCPYNSSVFAAALDLSIFDDESVETVKYLKIDEDFKAYVDDKLSVLATVSEVKSFVSKKYYIHLRALLSGIDDISFMKSATQNVCDSVISKYKEYYEMIKNNKHCLDFSSSIGKTDDIEIFVKNKIYNIVPDDVFLLLMNECGHINLLSDIKPKEYEGKEDKQCIDEYYINAVIEKCKPLVRERLDKEEKKLKEEEQLKQKEQIEAQQKAAKKKRLMIILALLISGVFIFVVLLIAVIIPKSKYNKAISYMNDNEFDKAIETFNEISNYKDVPSLIDECNDGKRYMQAESLFEDQKYEDAEKEFLSLGEYKDSKQRAKDARNEINELKYQEAEQYLSEGDTVTAKAIFSELDDYKDSYERAADIEKTQNEALYQEAEKYYSDGNRDKSYEIFASLGDFSDSKERAKKIADEYSKAKLEDGDLESAVSWYKKAGEEQIAYQIEYEYVGENYNDTDVTTYNFLKDLADANYEDSKSLYDKLYKISFSWVFNTDKDDTTTNLTEVNYKEHMFPMVHYIFEGGYPGQQINITIQEECLLGSGREAYENAEWQQAMIPVREYPVNVNEWNLLSLSETGSNVLYHRFTLTDSDTGEEYGVIEVFTPYE